jgi:hypothetical protein
VYIILVYDVGEKRSCGVNAEIVPQLVELDTEFSFRGDISAVKLKELTILAEKIMKTEGFSHHCASN